MKTQNLDYIRQFLKESQLDYSLIYPTITDVLIHLLFVNGNGVTFINGNPQCDLSYNRTVPFTEYYKDQKTFETCKEYYYNYYLERKVSENVKRGKEYNFQNLTDDELYENEYKKICDRLDDLLNIDLITDTNIMKISFHYNNMYSDVKYRYLYRLSKDYYKICKMYENTEQNLLKLTIIMCKASIQYFTDICSGKIKLKENRFTNKLEDDLIRLNDIELMKNDILRLEGYLKIND